MLITYFLVKQKFRIQFFVKHALSFFKFIAIIRTYFRIKIIHTMFIGFDNSTKNFKILFAYNNQHLFLNHIICQWLQVSNACWNSAVFCPKFLLILRPDWWRIPICPIMPSFCMEGKEPELFVINITSTNILSYSHQIFSSLSFPHAEYIQLCSKEEHSKVIYNCGIRFNVYNL